MQGSSDFYSVMAYVKSAHIPLATASLIAKIKGKKNTQENLLHLKKCIFFILPTRKQSKGSEGTIITFD